MSSEQEVDEITYGFAYLSDLAVASSARKRGIGRLLVAECENIARAAGRRWLRLGVLAGNGNARRFYKDLGFEEISLELEKNLQ